MVQVNPRLPGVPHLLELVSPETSSDTGNSEQTAPQSLEYVDVQDGALAMPARLRGWLLDLYDDAADGLHLWFILEDGERVCLQQPMPVTFYAAGETEQLRDLWKMLRKYPRCISLQRESAAMPLFLNQSPC